MSHEAEYTVDEKREVREFGKNGEVVTAYQIYATSAGGTYFHVTVLESELDQADQVIAARARQLDAIK